MPEATLRDGVPQTAGWFVVNARDARWMHNDMRSSCRFGGEGEAHFDELGIGLFWLEPGRPMSMYHREGHQEDFLVLRGDCVLVVEGEERPLRPWDLFHCPPGVPHVIVAGAEPALVLAVGARGEKGTVRYPADPAAARHGASVATDTASPAEAYAAFADPQPGPPPPGL
jgi:uncharacterized cupin superfamily protein